MKWSSVWPKTTGPPAGWLRAWPELPGVHIDLETVQTNLVIFSVPTLHANGGSFAEVLGQAGVKIGAIGGERFRAVTHYGISHADIDAALQIIRQTWQPAAA